jgi:hypothetical protein
MRNMIKELRKEIPLGKDAPIYVIENSEEIESDDYIPQEIFDRIEQ